MGVADEFRAFKDNYNIGSEMISAISYRYRRITGQLNYDFRSLDSDTAHSLYVGSYGRDTAAQGISDLDVGYLLPNSLHAQYNGHCGNGQSALLQAVRSSIRKTYSTSDTFGDGQVVVIDFDDGVKFEILPYFLNTAGTWTYPDSNGGGSWKTCNPRAEIEAVEARNITANGNLKHLCRMMRVWNKRNSAGMTGALIDTLAYQFMENWSHRDKSFLYHDWMARDFLEFLSTRDRTQLYYRMPGSGSSVHSYSSFEAKAAIDYPYAVEACNLTTDDQGQKRREKWRYVFGSTFPV